MILIAFLVSLFVGTPLVCIGLGAVVVVIAIILMIDKAGWLD